MPDLHKEKTGFVKKSVDAPVEEKKGLPAGNKVAGKGLPAGNKVAGAGLPAGNKVAGAGLPAGNKVAGAGLPAGNKVAGAGLPAGNKVAGAGLPAGNKVPEAQVANVAAGSTQDMTGKSIEDLAKEVIRGNWGNGDERKKRLTEAGYDYDAIQKKVNELLK